MEEVDLQAIVTKRRHQPWSWALSTTSIPCFPPIFECFLSFPQSWVRSSSIISVFIHLVDKIHLSIKESYEFFNFKSWCPFRNQVLWALRAERDNQRRMPDPNTFEPHLKTLICINFDIITTELLTLIVGTAHKLVMISSTNGWAYICPKSLLTKITELITISWSRSLVILPTKWISRWRNVMRFLKLKFDDFIQNQSQPWLQA